MDGISDASAPVVTPQQTVDAPLRPEQRLLLAVLERALEDFRTYALVATGRGNRIFMDVHAWFFDSSATGPCDFEGICQAVGLEPDFVRKGLRRWDRGLHAPYVGCRWTARQVAAGAVDTTYRRSA